MTSSLPFQKLCKTLVKLLSNRANSDIGDLRSRNSLHVHFLGNTLTSSYNVHGGFLQSSTTSERVLLPMSRSGEWGRCPLGLRSRSSGGHEMYGCRPYWWIPRMGDLRATGKCPVSWWLKIMMTIYIAHTTVMTVYILYTIGAVY